MPQTKNPKRPTALSARAGSPLYAERDPMQLDEDGGYYYRHVHGMTKHGLHSKSDIAAELAWRDREIDRLKQVIYDHVSETIDNCQANSSGL